MGGPSYNQALEILEQEFGRGEREYFDYLTRSKGRGKGDNVPAAATAAAAVPAPAAGGALPEVAQHGKGAGKGNALNSLPRWVLLVLR